MSRFILSESESSSSSESCSESPSLTTSLSCSHSSFSPSFAPSLSSSLSSSFSDSLHEKTSKIVSAEEEWKEIVEVLLLNKSDEKFQKIMKNEWTVNYSPIDDILAFLHEKCNLALQSLNPNWHVRVRPRGSFVHKTAVASSSLPSFDVDVILNGLTTNDFALEYLGTRRFNAGCWPNFVSKLGKVLLTQLSSVAIDPTDFSRLQFVIHNIKVELCPKVTGNDGIVYGKPKSAQSYGAETSAPDLNQQNPLSETQRAAIMILKKWKMIFNVPLKSYHLVIASKQCPFKEQAILDNIVEHASSIIEFLVPIYETGSLMNTKYSMNGNEAQMHRDYTNDAERHKVLRELKQLNRKFQLNENQIREEAYYVWEKNGRPCDRDSEMWMEARRVLLLQ